jgi:hypothetical protein
MGRRITLGCINKRDGGGDIHGGKEVKLRKVLRKGEPWVWEGLKRVLWKGRKGKERRWHEQIKEMGTLYARKDGRRDR